MPHVWSEEAEPAHSIPPRLEKALIEGKRWYDRREQLEQTIQTFGGIAERNQADREVLDLEAASILADVVEAIEETWGFGSQV